MILLALSCLQGRLAVEAAEALLALGPDGLQLTPGNVPGVGLGDVLDGRVHRTHHGFHVDAMRQPVWGADGACLVQSDSVHPPRLRDAAYEDWWLHAETGRYEGLTLETMHPGYRLGRGPELERAMDLGLELAVDVAHLFMQRAAGVLHDVTLRRLLSYRRVSEVHVSANDGRADAHRPIEADTFGLAWAREREQHGAVLVLECYMHALSIEARRKQLALIRGEA